MGVLSFVLRIDSQYHDFFNHPLNSSSVIFSSSHSVLFSRACLLQSANLSSVYFPALIQAKRRLYSRRYSWNTWSLLRLSAHFAHRE